MDKVRQNVWFFLAATQNQPKHPKNRFYRNKYRNTHQRKIQHTTLNESKNNFSHFSKQQREEEWKITIVTHHKYLLEGSVYILLEAVALYSRHVVRCNVLFTWAASAAVRTTTTAAACVNMARCCLNWMKIPHTMNVAIRLQHSTSFISLLCVSGANNIDFYFSKHLAEFLQPKSRSFINFRLLSCNTYV